MNALSVGNKTYYLTYDGKLIDDGRVVASNVTRIREQYKTLYVTMSGAEYEYNPYNKQLSRYTVYKNLIVTKY